ncbi:hypothetical protein B296_00025218 [Ensete ventricosum]|uniref:Uncharacterized protein n=1 Tax=Ensete ventricosum TaxID=4639 RepID=A0A427AH46_ENSVE|nr:hypothetical protein B296_00025218 [Ensete ventricosum]
MGFSRPKRRLILDLTASVTTDAFDFKSSESDDDDDDDEEEESTPSRIFSFICSIKVSSSACSAIAGIASPNLTLPLLSPFLSPSSRFFLDKETETYPWPTMRA